MGRRVRISAATTALAIMLQLPTLAQQATTTPPLQDQPPRPAPIPSQHAPGQQTSPANTRASNAAVNTGLSALGGDPLRARSASARLAQLDNPSGRPISPKTQDSTIGIAPTQNQNTPGQELRPVETTVGSTPVRSGLFPSFGNTLLNNGVEFHGVVLDHYFANPDAGNTPGFAATNLGVFRPSVDFDLNKIAGIYGASIHTSLTYFFTKNNEPGVIAQTGGALTGYQTTPVLESTVLTKLTYEQKFLADRLDVEVGRANVHQYFFIPNSLDIFTYDSPVLYVDADFNSIPYGPYMGKATYHLTPFWYLQAGAFEDDYRDEVKEGWKFGDSRASGAQILAEVGYRSEFNTEAYPANLEAGFEWNTRTGYSNTKGTGNNALRTTSATDYAGGGVIYWQGAKVIYRGPAATAPGNSPQNIQVYSQADFAVDQPQPINLDILAGVNFTGFVPCRPNDILGVQARGVQLSSVEAGFETREHTLLNRGRYVQQPKTGLQLEAMYQLTFPYATVTAYGQYYANPDDYEVPFVNHIPYNGAEAGFVLRIPLGPLLGTSNKPF